jgi:hypothetical protein
MQKGSTRLELGGLSVEAVVGREHDNVADDPGVATGRTDLLGALLAYGPALPPGGTAQAVLGQPRLELGYQQLRDRTISLPEGVTDKADRRNSEWSASLGSTYALGDWRAGYRSRREEDVTGASADRTTTTAEGSLSLRLWERVTLGLRGQLARDKEEGTDRTRTNSLAGGDLALVLIKERLLARVAYQADRRKASDDSENQQTRTTDFGLELTLRQAADNKPGVVVNLKGQQQKVDDRVNHENDKEPLQVFLGVNIGWPASTAGTWR